MIKIVQVSVRYSEGGAAQIARSIHEKTILNGGESKFFYGYSKNINLSSRAGNNEFMLGNKSNVLLNYISYKIINKDIFSPSAGMYQKYCDFVKNSDVLHLHAIHSYFSPIEKIIYPAIKYRKKIVWTMHDHWLATGRCAFLDGCNAWLDGCGNCSSKNNYPPAFFDLSRTMKIQKKKILESIYDLTTYVSPSKHLARDIVSSGIGIEDIKIIPNSIDESLEKIIKNNTSKKNINFNNKLPIGFVVANDLSYDGKTKRDIVDSIIGMGVCNIVTAGKNSPFHGPNVINFGEVKDREEMLSIYNSVDFMLFTSTVDNFPLVICESLCSGVPVVATKSNASLEVLDYVGEKVCDSLEDLLIYIREKKYLTNKAALSNLALAVFNSNLMYKNYEKIFYEKY